MKIKTLASAAALFALTAVALPGAASAQGVQWKIDPAHSVAEFNVDHMVVSRVPGVFSDIRGEIDLRMDEPTRSSVDVQIPIATLNTRNEKRDAHLKSPDFFDAENHPTMNFKSTRITLKNAKKREFNVTGKLTIRGVTKNVTLVATVSEPMKSPWGVSTIGIHATTEIDRRDFGLTWNKTLESGSVLVGNEVRIAISMELNKVELKSSAPKS
jgi:polyisoprenoid-binding protein YceI